MNREQLTHDVLKALSGIPSPSEGDPVSRGQVQNLEVGEDGSVRFSFFMTHDDPGSLVKDLRSAAEAVEGVTSVKVNVQLPQAAPSGPPGPQGGPQPGTVPAPTPQSDLLPDVDRIIAVSSGKGGVGKSMVAANLAAALAKGGNRVGLLDADVYGPNIHVMFGNHGRPQVVGEEGRERIAPVEAHGVKLMSLGFMLDPEQPAIMRGPLISGILRQFLEQVAWGPLDFLVVDLPPGTGDAQISLAQAVEIDGAVMVTTPQMVSVGDVRRGVKMFDKVETPVLGIVENMSGYQCPDCGHVVDVFGKGGGEALAKEMELPFLGFVPLDPGVREAGDVGEPTVVRAPDSPAGTALQELAETVVKVLESGPE
jgi:ATP-binding protein involved in chromosome partitioning